MPSASKTKQPKAISRLQELTYIILEVAEAKGWEAECDFIDEINQRYSSVSVSRYYGGSINDVSAKIELTCHEVVKLSIQKTTFYSNGLTSLKEDIWEEFERKGIVQKREKGAKTDPKPGGLLETYLRRFHRSARQLQRRHSARPTIVIRDEYDVQDYIHAILKLLFDDVRTEEHCPSYAGSNSRIDFIIKSEKLAVEIKMANPKLTDKKIGEQLIVDIQRYSTHPECQTLLCFVYDPDTLLNNPHGLETDLTRLYNKLDVRVVVVSPG